MQAGWIKCPPLPAVVIMRDRLTGQPCCGLVGQEGTAMKNLLTDVAGVRVGHADDVQLASGVTAILFDRPAVASVDIRCGGPGTRESALLDAVSTVDAIHGLALAGGSAF